MIVVLPAFNTAFRQLRQEDPGFEAILRSYLTKIKVTVQTQKLRTLANGPRDGSSVPSTYVRRLTSLCNYGCRESNTLFGTERTLAIHVARTPTHVYAYTHAHTQSNVARHSGTYL